MAITLNFDVDAALAKLNDLVVSHGRVDVQNQ